MTCANEATMIHVAQYRAEMALEVLEGARDAEDTVVIAACDTLSPTVQTERGFRWRLSAVPPLRFTAPSRVNFRSSIYMFWCWGSRITRLADELVPAPRPRLPSVAKWLS